MKLLELLQHGSRILAEKRDGASARGLDAPITASAGRLVATAGSLYQYSFTVPVDAPLKEDQPMTILPLGDMEPTEGFVVDRRADTVVLQTFDGLGRSVNTVTIVPDAAGFFDTASQRLADMATRLDAYSLGPAERLVPWLHPHQSGPARASASTSILTTLWTEDLPDRRMKLATLVIEQVRSNKRLLLISPDHRSTDEVLGTIARAMRAAGLPFKSLLCRYEMPLLVETSGLTLQELGFETQVHQFYARSQADKASLRRKYERFRELTPLLAYKAQKQQDLNEVKHLEWRLLTQISDLQTKIKDIDATLAEYEALPVWKRLAMQTMGQNTASLAEYRILYEQQVQLVLAELEVAKRRIEELSPEAAIPKELRPEYNGLKEEIKRLGGTKQIRELLAAQEGTNRQAFMQNKRVVATTPARVLSDPLFARVRFDILIADEAPRISAPFLLGAAGLVRERIVLSGDLREISTAQAWADSLTTTLTGPPLA